MSSTVATNGGAALRPPLPSLPSLERTPVLEADSAAPSPAFEALVSPALFPVDKELSLDPAAPAWRMPECWGHRGVSGVTAENTIMSFTEACKAGADGIETDIHITADNVLVMFHDPNLDRTTDGKGKLHDQPWVGVLEHVRTLEQPAQPIPRFTQVIELLMKPENQHVKLNIDCKVENDPVKLFGLIKGELEQYEEWQTKLAPRLVLGLWHPKFIEPAADILPDLKRFCISMSIPQVRKYFYDKCHGFSVWYHPLASADGAKFREECRKAGKEICTWTVNGREEMINCARWGIYSIISDKPELWRDVKRDLEADRAKVLKPTLSSYILPYFDSRNYSWHYVKKGQEERDYLEKEAGSFDIVTVPEALRL
ncbi:hypothetical protein VHUM_00952 [Vanrija humicola]|uniref:GP-PDE domain-containing protein n=1 Tax=Vanrija humicola TaxID=5417 RepID=A0A7D8V207_VANHU|nr:hypothetical protein VHUM_00952 [Vanrija humicola]